MSIVRVLRNGQWVRKGYVGVPAQYNEVANPGDNIQAILDSAANDDAILIKSGVHRITAPINPKSGQTLAGEVGTVISGSKVLSTWTSDGSGRWYSSGHLPAVYSDSGQCDDTSQNICQKREQVFINDVHLTRVMNVSAVTADTFYEDYGTNRVYIGQDPSGKTIEMSSTHYAVRSSNNNIRITGLTFQHFATPSQQGAVFADGGEDWEIDHNTFCWNHAIAIYVSYAHRIHIHHNHIHHNGQLGIGHARTNDSIIEDNEVSFNNTDGYYGGDWESGGIKLTRSWRTIVRRNNVHDNHGIGVWYDINNNIALITDNDVNDQFACGIRYEISYEAEISFNRLKGNGYGFASFGRNGDTNNNSTGSLFGTSAINVNGSPDVEVHHNTLGPNQNGICGQERNRTNSDTDMSLGPWDLHNLWVHHNTITQTTGSGFGYGIAAGLNTLGTADTTEYYTATKNNSFDHNTYYLDNASAARFSWDHGYRTFSYWQSATRPQELNGTCTAAPVAGWQVAVAADDGNWHNVGSGMYSSTGSRLYIGNISESDRDRHAWLRFTGVTIPKNATIQSAALRVYATGLSGIPPSMTISAEEADNASAPSTRTDVNNRAHTSANVAWTPATWPSGQWRISSDISTIIQEIVNRTNWNSGNAMQMFVSSDADGPMPGQISFWSYDGDAALSANLQVTWN